MAIPAKILNRKDEITTDFLKIYKGHLQDLFAGRAIKRLHSSDFANLLCIHPGHLTNTLKLTTGKSPCEFMEEAIATEAQRLLRETDLSVEDIAERFVYGEATNFIRFFKITTGCTPLQYRKNQSAGI